MEVSPLELGEVNDCNFEPPKTEESTITLSNTKEGFVLVAPDDRTEDGLEYMLINKDFVCEGSVIEEPLFIHINDHNKHRRKFFIDGI